MDLSGAYCIFGIQKSGNNNWLLGDVFLRNFYTVWDNAKSEIGIAPHITSDSTWLTTWDMHAPFAVYSPLYKQSNVIIKVAEITAAISVAGIAAVGFGFIAMVILDYRHINQLFYYILEVSMTYLFA